MILPSVFFSYCHADEELRDQLEKQLAMLKHQGIIETWHDRRIVAGQEIDKTIDEHINSDDIILLLVSPDFLASPYCYDREIKRALEPRRLALPWSFRTRSRTAYGPTRKPKGGPDLSRGACVAKARRGVKVSPNKG